MPDYRAMTFEEFDGHLRALADKFKQQVATDPNYQFARDGDRLALGDWFEQFATHSELM